MNICIVIDKLDFGGAERVALNFIDHQLKNGNSITLITIDDIVKVQIDERIHLHTLNFENKLFKYYFNKKKMYTLLDNLQEKNGTFDLILVHLYKASRVMKNYKHSCIFHIIHSTQSKSALKDKKGFKRKQAQRKIQNVYDNLNLICVSNGVKEDLLNVMEVVPKSIKTIYNPFNIEEIRSKGNEVIDERFSQINYIIFVGRLVKEKRVDYLLNAYKASNISDSLIILGDGEEKNNLLKQATTLKIQDKVIFVGSVQNPYPYINNAKFLVLCSLYEGLPTVLIESLILQTPIVSTDCPSGPKEIAKFYTDDALVDDNFDMKKLSDKLIQFATNAPSVDIHCMDLFDAHNISDQYIKLYEARHK